MSITVIDSDHYVDVGIQTMFFPGGEPHVKVPAFYGSSIALYLKLRTWADTGFAALVIDALEQGEANEVYPFIAYFPGARQDRSDGRAAFTLHRMASLLSCYGGVSVFDPHSNVLREVVDVNHVFMPADLTLEIKSDVVGIIAPDAGAVERATAFRNHFYPHCELIECSKRRDSQSGALSGYVMPALRDLGRYIVVDDICDGGGTFNLLAAEFKADRVGAQSALELFVSHGIFSKGLGAIDSVYQHITTTDSWCRLPSYKRLTVLPLAPLLPLLMEPSHA